MAGCFQSFQGEERFVILTTQANASVSPVHHRMPLVLEKNEIENWIFDDQSVEFILHKTPPELMRRTEYEQLQLFS
jgi:putative SOS response-associated peptidase YedK